MAHIETTDTRKLTADETRDLVTWMGWQDEHHHDGRTLQEILDLYHASSAYDGLESYYEAQTARAYVDDLLDGGVPMTDPEVQRVIRDNELQEFFL